MAYECIKVDTEGAVGVITLNRPDARNTARMHDVEQGPAIEDSLNGAIVQNFAQFADNGVANVIAFTKRLLNVRATHMFGHSTNQVNIGRPVEMLEDLKDEPRQDGTIKLERVAGRQLPRDPREHSGRFLIVEGLANSREQRINVKRLFEEIKGPRPHGLHRLRDAGSGRDHDNR